MNEAAELRSELAEAQHEIAKLRDENLKLLVDARTVWLAIGTVRVYSVDQNIRGWRDLLGAMASKADRMLA